MFDEILIFMSFSNFCAVKSVSRSFEFLRAADLPRLYYNDAIKGSPRKGSKKF